MIITDMIEIFIGRGNKKSAYKVYIDDDYAFLLYSQDIKTYQLEAGAEITSLLYDKIIKETVLRRAKQKALAILKHMDRTEKELYTKLKAAYYTDEIIESAMKYLKDYNYIDDERYALNYIRTRKNITSKLVIQYKLSQKGINKDISEKIMDMEYDSAEEDSDPEIIAINKAIRKKCKDTDSLTWEEKQKLMASLYRKGFDMGKINQCLHVK